MLALIHLKMELRIGWVHEFGQGIEKDVHEVPLGGLVSELRRKVLTKIADIPLLTGDGDPLSIFGPGNAIILHGSIRGIKPLTVKEITADHDTSATLASLTMDSDDIERIGFEPLINIFAKGQHQSKRGRIVIIKGIAHYFPIEFVLGVRPF